ncbi:MAG: sugar ABC transporter ATP-binding protein [Clostridiales bacterium]|nr:sugar ABC transporter ATP-binding protein [Clostridiales bacterium]
MVEMQGISKAFPGVQALDKVDFKLRPGEVMALLGENGAGKSTLMKILSGVYQRDEGEIRVFGKDVELNLTPRKAQDLGISIIHQELNMCRHLSVAENIFLGREILSKGGRLDNKAMNRQAAEVLQSMNIKLDPTLTVDSLPLFMQQMVEIAKAISTDSKLIIMDEPTSSLTSREIEELFSIVRELRGQGRGIVYISHRLEELQHIVDQVTILRDGQFVASMPFKDTNLQEIISYMVGRDIKEKYPRVECPVGEKILEVKNLNAGHLVRDISLEARSGEIVGIAGLVGAGRTETLRAIFGAAPKESGQVFIDGKELKIHKPMDAISQGLVLVPEDRKHDGLCVKLSVRSNIELPNLDILSSKAGRVNVKKVTKAVKQAIRDLNIRLPGDEVDTNSLSGGNQQKVVVAKWLVRQSRMVLFDEPTRGIDVAAKVEIYHLMNKLKEQGIGVICVSSELQEILGICDRIIVMCDGRITGEMPRAEATQEKIMALATQFEKKIGAVSA